MLFGGSTLSTFSDMETRLNLGQIPVRATEGASERLQTGLLVLVHGSLEFTAIVASDKLSQVLLV